PPGRCHLLDRDARCLLPLSRLVCGRQQRYASLQDRLPRGLVLDQDNRGPDVGHVRAATRRRYGQRRSCSIEIELGAGEGPRSRRAPAVTEAPAGRRPLTATKAALGDCAVAIGTEFSYMEHVKPSFWVSATGSSRLRTNTRTTRLLPPLHLSANKPPATAVQRLPPAGARTYKLSQMVRLGARGRSHSQARVSASCRRGGD